MRHVVGTNRTGVYDLAVTTADPATVQFLTPVPAVTITTDHPLNLLVDGATPPSRVALPGSTTVALATVARTTVRLAAVSTPATVTVETGSRAGGDQSAQIATLTALVNQLLAALGSPYGAGAYGSGPYGGTP